MAIETDISVIICAYNAVDRLRPTLEHLAKQSVPSHISWKIILIDNNSSDNTTGIAQKIWKDLGEPVEMLRLSETRQGQGYAREKGLRAAQSRYVLFCDDDNWLSPNYIAKAFERMESDANIGVTGGWAVAVFEGEKPDWFDPLKYWYAVPDKKPSGYLLPHEFVVGAGMCVRKEIYTILKERNFEFLLSGRKDKALTSGDDIEIQLAAQLLGFKIFFDETLFFRHCIASHRLNWGYFKKMRRGGSKSFLPLVAYHHTLKKYPKGFFFSTLFCLKNMVMAPVWAFLLVFRQGCQRQEYIQLIEFAFYDGWRVKRYMALRKSLALMMGTK